jgi:hypothetical protein
MTIIFYCHIARSTDNNKGNKYDSHATIKYNMLLFAGCNDNHIAPSYDQLHEYTKVGYGKYTGDGVYLAKGVYVPKGKYIEYAEDGLYVAKGKYGNYVKEDASIANPLPRMAAGLGTTMRPLPQGQLAAYVMQGNNEPLLTTRAIGRICRARQQ